MAASLLACFKFHHEDQYQQGVSMFRTSFRLAMLTIGVAILFSTIPAHSSDKDKSKSRAPLVHVVIVYLNQDAPADAADGLIADAQEMLAKIPSVREMTAGKPAPKTGFAKTDYQVGLLLRFDDLEGLQAYEKHPQHQEFVKKHSKNVQLDKLTVFDFIDQNK
jgi:hypothetical protein